MTLIYWMLYIAMCYLFGRYLALYWPIRKITFKQFAFRAAPVVITAVALLRVIHSGGQA